MKTIQQIAAEMLDNLELKTRDDGSRFYAEKTTIEWQQDIIRGAHLDRMPSDDIYERIYNILERLSELDEQADEDEARDTIYEIEPDCYTSDLTKWLHDNINNVYYLEEAISQGATTGFDLLAIAQQIYIQEIGNDLLNGITEHISELEETE